MSEQDIRDGLRAAVWDEPPLDFDPDSLIAQAEQVTRRRRALASVGTATALLIATIVSLPAFLAGAHQPVGPAAESLNTTATASSVPRPSMVWPPKGVRRVSYDWATVQPRLLDVVWPALSRNLQLVAPGATDIGVWKPDFRADWYSVDRSAQDVINGPVTYVDDGLHATLDVTIAGPGGWARSPSEMCDIKVPVGTCEVLSRPDGTQLVLNDCVPIPNKCGAGQRSLYHFRLDGSVVGMTSISGSFDVGATSAPGYIPLSLDQLTTLVTDPEMRLTN